MRSHVPPDVGVADGFLSDLEKRAPSLRLCSRTYWYWERNGGSPSQDRTGRDNAAMRPAKLCM